MSETSANPAALSDVIRRYWGYDALRPLQREAMEAALAGRDGLMVLPTGGGKSLCYQAPALLCDRVTVVVSPLISLMKDQVDGLIQRGVPAAFVNSSLEPADRRRVHKGLLSGEYKLLFVAPERFSAEPFLALLDEIGVAGFAIDEAHCISHWGHDFRAEYRRMGMLKQRYPGVPVQGFTATATPRVREDIVEQLGLADPVMLVGDFFRPNLTYRVARRGRGFDDVIDALRQRKGSAGIVYCIRRDDVDALTALLRETGVEAAGYHAGMDDAERTRIQDAFSAGETDVIVATVAFGMGIDRADIRYVIHAAMPKSLEHYQQETGRAGRDGEPAECLLFYTGGDFGLWQTIVQNQEGNSAEQHLALLREMYGYCTSVGCRHRRLVTYFGQPWERDGCGACDFCLGGARVLENATEVAQKILSCVVRTGQRFGAGHVADVLVGKPTEKVLARQHNELSTFGLLADQAKPVVMQWLDQLVDHGLLCREGEFRTLSVTPEGWQVLRSQAEATLYEVDAPAAKRSGGRARSRRRSMSQRPDLSAATHEASAPRPLDVDEQRLFERLRALRREIAEEGNIPAFMVFADRTLREMARVRPTSRAEMLAIRGVGAAKWDAFGQQFLDAVAEAARS